MLLDCLNSILNQSFKDYEVIIGNDFTGEFLESSNFKINDERFKFVNHEKNLGEINNMNYLLNSANGFYFTWLADDDAYDPNLLESIYETYNSNRHATVIYPEFRSDSLFKPLTNDRVQIINYNGNEFK